MTHATGRLDFLVHAPQKAGQIGNELGRADYSYYFVMRHFLPVLGQLGRVVQVDDPATQSAAMQADSQRGGATPVQLFFMPPNKLPEGLSGHVMPVFAWEYSTIPSESWGGDARHDWASVLSATGCAITHSAYARSATREALGAGYPVCSLPAPVWDDFARLREKTAQPSRAPWTLAFTGVTLDSRHLGLEHCGGGVEPDLDASPQRVELDGVIYTAVFNPNDQRKNFYDLLTAFVWAFRDEPRATLLMKLVHHDAAFACGIVLHEMKKLSPFRCRVVAIHGYLDDTAYAAMIRGSSYTVNSSHGEGQCLPLMEFMSAGKPAIAPDHTAMAEYVREDNAFVVRSWREWTHWPHDPRLVLRCFRHRIDWESLRLAYLESWRVATADPARYRRMSRNAGLALRGYCSRAVVSFHLHRFLQSQKLPVAALPLRVRGAAVLLALRRRLRV